MLTPSQARDRGEFFHRLAVYLSSGIAPREAAQHLRTDRSLHGGRRLAAAVGDGIDGGLTLTDSLKTARILGEFDLSLIEAGEASGRIDHSLRVLGEVYRQRARLMTQVISQAIYPLVLLHAAALIAPVPTLVLSGNVTGYIVGVCSLLLPFYALAGALFLASFVRSPSLRTRVETAVSWIPLLGSARQDLALARLALSLEALLNAGVPTIKAWLMASESSGSSRLRNVVATWRESLESGGLTPGELVCNEPLFPALFGTSYKTGELSGKLDECLSRLHAYYSEEALRKFQMLASALPKLFYAIVASIVVLQIFKTFSLYNDQLKQIIGP